MLNSFHIENYQRKKVMKPIFSCFLWFYDFSGFSGFSDNTSIFPSFISLLQNLPLPFT